MRALLLCLLLPSFVQAAEHDHAAMSATPAPVQQAHDHSSHNESQAGADFDMSAAVHDHGGMWQYSVLLDRFERQFRNGEDALQWRGDYWLGGDINKFWLKSEGNWLQDKSEVHDSETQLLFSHAITPFWDLQSGLAHNEAVTAGNFAVLGVQGMAPYWFHVEAALLIGDDQRLANVEVAYDMRLTQRLILQPRLQLRYAFNGDNTSGIAQGLYDSTAGIRLRYELLREFAPFVGLEQDIGSVRQADEKRVVLGLRLQY